MIRSRGNTVETASRWLGTLALFSLALLYLLPMFVSVMAAFRTDADLLSNGFLSLPHPWYFGGFASVWHEGSISLYMRNSVIVSLLGVLLTVCGACLAGYALARFKFRGQGLLLLVFLAGLFFPPQIYIIPIYRLAVSLHIYNTYLGLILVHIAYQLPFSILLLRSFFKTIPTSLLDAARIDGAGELRILARIVVPLAIPALGATTILLFTWIWNDFFWALSMTHTVKAQTIMVGVSQYYGRLAVNWNQEAASSLLAMLPPLVMFLLFQRLFIRGVRMGGIK